MNKAFTTLALVFLFGWSYSQNLLIEAFSGANFTAFEPVEFENSEVFIPLGFRIAGGLPNLQLGGEFHTSISNPEFTLPNIGEQTTTEFSTNYYGGFIRGNISPNPAYGFGIILKAGVGIYDYELTTASSLGESTFEYNTLGFNGGIGVSIPVGGAIHLEAGYMYYFVQFDEDGIAPELKAPYHSLQLGFSYNGLFGQQASRNRQNKRWKNGWRGSAGNRYKKWKG